MNQAIEDAWKRRATDKKVTNQDVVAYCAIRAIYSKSNEKVDVFKGLLAKSFTPWTNENKIFFQTPHTGPHKGDPYYTMTLAIQAIVNNIVNGNSSSIFGMSELNDQEQAQFMALIYSVKDVILEDPEVVFIWVDKTLPKVQQVIQVAHLTFVMASAMSKKSLRHIDNFNRNVHFVVFGCEDTQALCDKEMELLEAGLVTEFYDDPSVTGTINATAVGLYPMRKSEAFRKRIGLNDTLLVIE